jgi:hypothetical protein
MRFPALRTLLATALLSLASPALSAETWLYAATPAWSLGWNLSGLAWKFDKVSGTMLIYSPDPTPLQGKNVHWVLQDFTMDCKARTYQTENTIFYGPDRKMIDAVFGGNVKPLEKSTPEYVLAYVLCDGGTLSDTTVKEAPSADQAMIAMAVVPPRP